MPLTTILQNGDTVSIITSDSPKGPSRAWLAFAKTNTARHRIMDYFKKTSPENKLKLGETLLQKEFDRAGLGLIKAVPHKKIKDFCKNQEIYKNFKDILVAIGEGTMSTLDIIQALYPKKSKDIQLEKPFTATFDYKPPKELKTVTIKIVIKDSIGQLEKIVGVISSQNISILKTHGRRSWWTNNFVLKLTVAVTNFARISKLFETLEQIEGIESLERLFWQRKLIFFIGSSVTFSIWAAHPFILHYISTSLLADLDPLVVNILNYLGISMLLIMVFLLKSLTQRSFPELRETNSFWALTFLLSTFALITLFAEIYFFKISFSWVFVFGVIMIVFAYLTAEYIRYREKI
jgi:hypothetical protein